MSIISEMPCVVIDSELSSDGSDNHWYAKCVGFPNNASKYNPPQLEQMLNNQVQEALEKEEIARQIQQQIQTKTNISISSKDQGNSSGNMNFVP